METSHVLSRCFYFERFLKAFETTIENTKIIGNKGKYGNKGKRYGNLWFLLLARHTVVEVTSVVLSDRQTRCFR